MKYDALDQAVHPQRRESSSIHFADGEGKVLSCAASSEKDHTNANLRPKPWRQAPSGPAVRLARESYVDLTVVADYLGFTVFLVAIGLIAVPIVVFGI
jgi:hypothetical protein